MGKLGNIVSATKTFLNFLGNIFASREANFVWATMFPEVGKQGNTDRKHVSATRFPSLSRALARFACKVKLLVIGNYYETKRRVMTGQPAKSGTCKQSLNNFPACFQLNVPSSIRRKELVGKKTQNASSQC